jgi:CPA1 family monovalent cation:H+ antiporter
VIAVVITGLYVGFRSPGVIRAESRVAAQLVWRTIQFLLENAVFLFIGLNLAGILEGAVRTGPGLWPTVGIVAAILAALILSRFVWVMITTFVYRFGPRVLRDRSWDVRNGIAVASASVRGVVTLAAVFLLPEQTPMREYLQFLAFVVVVASLIGGLALPRIVRALHLPARNDLQERTEVKLLMAEARQAGLRRLDETVTPDDEPRVVELLRADAAFLGETLDAGADAAWPQLQSMHRLRRAMIQAQREAVLVARRERRFQEVAVLAALRAIDAEETSLRAQEAEP